MDSVDPALVVAATSVLAGSPGVLQVERVRLRWVGHELLAEADIVAARSLNLSAAHAVAEEAHHRLLHQVPRLAQATIHVDPSGPDPVDHELTAHHFPAPGTGPSSP